MKESIWDKFGAFATGLIVRWSFKVLAGVLATLGVNEGQWELWIGALIRFIIGALLSKVQNNYLAKKEPTTILQRKNQNDTE